MILISASSITEAEAFAKFNRIKTEWRFIPLNSLTGPNHIRPEIVKLGSQAMNVTALHGAFTQQERDYFKPARKPFWRRK